MMNVYKKRENHQVFPILGHHLSYFADITTGRITPGELADDIVRDVSDASSLPSYTKDVLGKTKKEKRLVVDRFSRVFKRFVTLEDDAPVKITVGEKDLICNGCIVGKHCMRKGGEYDIDIEGKTQRINGYDMEDMQAISNFITLGRALTLTGVTDLIADDLLSVEPKNASVLTGRGAFIGNPQVTVDYAVPVIAPAYFVKTVLERW